MLNIGLIGGDFQHAYSSTLWKHPNLVEWHKGKVLEKTFFIDQAIIDNINTTGTEKYGWVVESRIIIPWVIKAFKENYKEISKSYKYVFTHYKELYDLAENFIYFPPHGFWINEPKIYPKTKIISMISSDKNFGPGHTIRLNYVKKFRNKLDLFGRNIKTIERKEEALCDYMFSVTIENDQYETYWTEKILDCFVSGTVPVYLGSPDIGNFFNMDGIILLTDNFDPSTLSYDRYISMMPAIQDNFERAIKFNNIEDLIYSKYLNKGI
ncbi:MAG: hypothetical protein IMZ63_02070 [Actinobacteria bacterium]|nr:hypothetical protein [Actinomycetota bacterium]